MKLRILFFALILVAFSSVAVLAQSAQQGGSTTTSSGQQGSESQRCSDVTKKVGLVVDRYNKNQEKYMTTAQNVFKNIEALALKFKADGYDTAELEKHMNEFNNMIQNASRYYNEFSNGLDNSKKSVCGNSEAQATQEFTRAREQLSLCKTGMLELRTFAEETLKQDLLDLKDQVTE